MIATRNRVSYAISAIQSILEIPDPRLELVVQDNSESRELESYVKDNIRDSRFRYRYTLPPFSSIDNFNAALEMATGEYLCLLGDDDGMNSELIGAAEWAKRENIDSLGVRHKVSYLWGGSGVLPTIFTKEPGACLSIMEFSGRIVGVDLKKEIGKLMHDGGAYHLNFNLPKLYHGLVHRRCLEAIREKTNAYLGGLSPDIFSSLAIACVAKNVVVTDYPLTIPGMCRSSSSIEEGAIKKHSKKLEDAPHFRDRGEYHWCELIPRVYAVEAIWADSGVAALRAMGRDDLVRQLNLPKLAAYCIFANRGVVWPVLHDLFKGMRIMRKNLAVGAIQFAWRILLLKAASGIKYVRRIWNRFLMIMGMKIVLRIDGLEDMVEASHALTRYLKENGYSFSDCARRKSEKLI